MASRNSSSFSLSGLGSGFADRQRDLFACLDAADKDRESSPRQPALPLPVPGEDEGDRDRMEPESGRRRRAPTKQFRGKESIFKRPEMPAPKRARHSVPDHQRNPHKWTKYTLGDVSSQDMSDRSNTTTALSFLQELKARKDQTDEMDDDEESSSTKAIVFKSSRPKSERRISSLGAVSTVSTTDTSEEADRPAFRSSKVVMPEYVVGQKKASKKKRTEVNPTEVEKNSKRKEVSLGHLMDEDE